MGRCLMQACISCQALHRHYNDKTDISNTYQNDCLKQSVKHNTSLREESHDVHDASALLERVLKILDTSSFL